jgi:hypothetical protein
VGKVIINLSDGACREPRLLESVRIECSRESSAAARTPANRKNLTSLWLQTFGVGIAIVNDADVNSSHVQVLKECQEFWIILIDMSVRVNGKNFCEPGQQSRLIIRCRAL